MKYFGVNLLNVKYGFTMTKENYAIINKKSSFRKGEVYSDEWCQNHLERCLINYDLNIKFFSSLDRNEFESSLERFVKSEQFKEVYDLNDYKGSYGHYMLVLDKFCQVYIGTTTDIRERVMTHWRARKPFDRLIFGSINNSILSIDSFRALDTTRIFANTRTPVYSMENNYINKFPAKFVLNRTVGGKLEEGLSEAILNRKTRKL